MRVAIYSRVSTTDGRQDTENQVSQLRAFCAANSWSVVQEYADEMSGKRSDRPAFQQMFFDASQRKFDLLVFWALDRLSREGVIETLNYLQQLTSYGVGYRSYTEQYLDSIGIFRDAVISILATIAKQERLRLSERTIAGLQRARRNGVRIGKPASYNAKQIAAVRSRRARGETFGSIAKAAKMPKSTVMYYCKFATLESALGVDAIERDRALAAR